MEEANTEDFDGSFVGFGIQEGKILRNVTVKSEIDRYALIGLLKTAIAQLEVEALKVSQTQLDIAA